MKYGFNISWTHRDGSITTVEVYDHDSLDDAKKAAKESAIYFGWTPPKWWQWWRWDDTRLNT